MLEGEAAVPPWIWALTQQPLARRAPAPLGRARFPLALTRRGSGRGGSHEPPSSRDSCMHPGAEGSSARAAPHLPPARVRNGGMSSPG